ncbi:VC0807 family protein [Streptomyces venezuelae]|uniref:VC0807 family protein n=1 Tax=Streptomyces venezuelae TaxID=54571 RepID=UPI001CC267FD|nr:VC0807 family protein [Streptomyces venezuelae]
MSQLATDVPVEVQPRTYPADEAGDARDVRKARVESLKPLVLDALVPTASYYLLSKGFGMGTMAALAWSSVVPAGRTAWGLVKERRVNGLAALILTANVVGLLMSLIAGDPRLMLAKDSGITATVGIAVLLSVVAGRPLMTAALEPWVTKGKAERIAAWQRLSAGRGRFVRLERTFSVVWGAALFGEALLRVVGAYTLPVDTMVWLGGAIAAVTITLTVWVSGALAVAPMEKMVAAEVVRKTAGEPAGVCAEGRGRC